MEGAAARQGPLCRGPLATSTTASSPRSSSFFPASWSTIAYSLYSSSSCIRGNTGISKGIKFKCLS